MEIEVPITEKDVKKIQRPESILALARSFGMVSEKRVREHIASLRKKTGLSRNWLMEQRRRQDRTKRLVLNMENRLGS
jgi:hypothetical protein